MARFNKTKETLVPLSAFTGGVDERIDDSVLKISYTPSAENVEIINGVFKVCQGTTTFFDIPDTNIKRAMMYYNQGKPYVITAGNGKLYQYDLSISAPNWAFMGEGFKSDNWDYVNHNVNGEDVIIMVNGVDNNKIWNGKNLRDQKMFGHASEDSAENKAPKGFFITMHYERVWIADDNYLFASSVTRDGIDVDDYTTPTDEEEVNQHGVELYAYTNDGTQIKGLQIVMGDIVVFKEKSIFKIFGNNPENYQKIDLEATGAIADHSIVSTPNGAFFVNSKGIYVFDGVNVKLISQKIENTWKRLNKKYLEKAQGMYVDDKYILAVALEESTTNNLIIEYNLTEKTFIFKNGLEVENFFEYGTSPCILCRNKILEYNRGEKWDNNTNINAFWYTPMTDMGEPNAVKELSTVYATVYSPKPGNFLKLTCVTEKKTKDKIITLKQGTHIYTINLNSRGRLLQFKIENIEGVQISVKALNGMIELDED